jgi:hypothetical protein
MSMRNVFFALVLANLAFAAWHAWYAQSPRPVPPARADVPRLTLVSELPPEAREPPSDVAEGEIATDASPALPPVEALSVAEPVDRCVSVGPFRDLAQAATAAANLRAAGYDPTQRVAEDDVWIGYWIYIQAIPTESNATEILQEVRAHGITDSYVIPNSDNGNLVSLGVFSEIGGVTRRRDEVRVLGYEPTIIDRTRRATVYWVDVVLGAGQVFDLESLQAPGRILRLEQRSCEATPG